jgi:hypothetical protein
MTIGIDPGSNGGIVCLVNNECVSADKMPEEDEGLVEMLRPEVGHDPQNDWVYIEQIPTWTGSKRFAKQTVYGHSIATLYGNFKFAQGLAIAFGYNVKLITPQRWQKLVECQNPERLEKSDWKRKLKGRAEELFPSVNVTMYSADALLIAKAGELWRSKNFVK